MHDHKTQLETVMTRRTRRLAWLSIALALAPLMGLVLVGFYEALIPPKGHNPFLAIGRPWMSFLMVLAITAPVHVPYIAVLCITAWGLFHRRNWARTAVLILAPVVAILSLFAWGGTIVAFHSWLIKGLEGSNVKETVLAFTPTAVLSATYVVAALTTLWNREVRDGSNLKQ